VKVGEKENGRHAVIDVTVGHAAVKDIVDATQQRKRFFAMTTLLLIDVQKDFHPGGSLAIPTADEDAKRIAALLQNHPHSIDRVVATLDSHAPLHIAHAAFWINSEGKNPDPFTIISAKDVETGVWKPRTDLVLPADGSCDVNLPGVMDGDKIDLHKYCVEYARHLEERGRFQLCIWPEHCLIGSPGHAVVDCVQQALHDWSLTTGRTVEWVLKGQHILTEMYSAFEADVPVSEETGFAQATFDSLCKSKSILVAGQAMSHCVNYTVRDLVSRWPEKETNKITILTDCASSVPGFEASGDKFCMDMKEKGVAMTESTDTSLFEGKVIWS